MTWPSFWDGSRFMSKLIRCMIDVFVCQNKWMSSVIWELSEQCLINLKTSWIKFEYSLYFVYILVRITSTLKYWSVNNEQAKEITKYVTVLPVVKFTNTSTQKWSFILTLISISLHGSQSVPAVNRSKWPDNLDNLNDKVEHARGLGILLVWNILHMYSKTWTFTVPR